MTIKDARIEATHQSNRRTYGRSPEAMTALAGRIRALQRSEPEVVGDERTAALAELNVLQLKLERLSLCTSRTDASQSQLSADTFALAEEVHRLARLWPSDATANRAMAAVHRSHRHDPDRRAA